MARFLSPEWFAEMNDLALVVDPDLELRLEQRVLGGPDGDVSYSVTISDGSVRFSPSTNKADATLTVDYPTARALATGELTAQDGFLQGRVRVTGDVARLQASGNALAAIASALAAARHRTTY